jgi:hypothetical protein
MPSKFCTKARTRSDVFACAQANLEAAVDFDAAGGMCVAVGHDLSLTLAACAMCANCGLSDWLLSGAYATAWMRRLQRTLVTHSPISCCVWPRCKAKGLFLAPVLPLLCQACSSSSPEVHTYGEDAESGLG